MQGGWSTGNGSFVPRPCEGAKDAFCSFTLPGDKARVMEEQWMSNGRAMVPSLCWTSLDQHYTLMVLSPDADTIYLSLKSTTLTAALCPTRTRRRTMS